ncbi:E3 ubiquitin-protein ligase TRIM23 isoform X1 [Apis cerana]|nr:E3 ubiquitin-protein ligase TRIM23 isoform X1 [Apis cerana]XP_016920656.1 E3 ubiquitin-protein ligase TRIM23 isoform X1 [Apis cerana]XP_061933985.1 E3 ubiquitin-protein ligase TRIM23 isoform X1 [Apis cerana]XP_061933986.1 E3 ubiquitin-protein ligase TRIM23 isoform X1 [Apis cerana]XP_061933987.1 E3 ubiquitin-protein ligase TRIM23 isoform X1 [Apis cerana]
MTNNVNHLNKYFKQTLKPTVRTNVLECRVCEEVFTIDGIKVPRLLHCGHTVCHSCLLRLRPCMTDQQFLLCPFDRQPTGISQNNIYNLKKNFALIELLERLEQSNSEKLLLLERERLQSSQSCDEDEAHTAVLYCTICMTHLCENCDSIIHSSKTLSKHKRVPLSEKPKDKPKCPVHTTHVAEFTCTQEGCHNSLMCYLCKDYGRHSTHKLALVEVEAENIRKSIITALQKMTQFMESMRDTANRIETVIQELEGWTIEDARQRVRQHFEELRALLADQENAAISCVETETRERLCALRQQQQDLTITRSQVADVCIQCESILDSEDWKLLSSATKVKEVLTTLEQQQQHYAQLDPDFLTPESSIPIIFSRDNRVHIGTKIDMRVVILGLDGAGKTSILSAMRGITLSGPPIPTIGFNVENLEYKNLVFTLWDVGGQQKFRPLWKHYYHNTQAVIFVIDASDRSRFKEAQNELSKIVNERELKDALFLIYANKQDVSGCASVEELTEILCLQKLCCGRAWHIQGSSLITNDCGSTQGLDWLTQQLGAHETLYTIPMVS